MDFISDADYSYDSKTGRWSISDAQFKRGLELQKSKLERDIRQNDREQNQLRLHAASISNTNNNNNNNSNVGEAEPDNYYRYPPGSIYAEAALSLKEMKELVNTPSNKIRDVIEMQKQRRVELTEEQVQKDQEDAIKRQKSYELMAKLTGAGQGVYNKNNNNDDLQKKSNEEEAKLHSGSMRGNKPMSAADIKTAKSYDLMKILTTGKNMHLI